MATDDRAGMRKILLHKLSDKLGECGISDRDLRKNKISESLIRILSRRPLDRTTDIFSLTLTKLRDVIWERDPSFRVNDILVDPVQSKPADEFLEKLHNQINSAVEKAQNEIRHADAKSKQEAAFLGELMREIAALNPGDRLYALCGRKNYASPGVYKYLDTFIDAAKRNVRVRRHYVSLSTSRLSSADFSPAEWGIVYAHLEWQKRVPSFRVSVLHGDQAEEHWERTSIPKYMGIVLVNKRLTPHDRQLRVYMHHGFHEDDAQDCCTIEDDLVFCWFRKIMDDIASESEQREMKTSVEEALKRACEVHGFPRNLDRNLRLP